MAHGAITFITGGVRSGKSSFAEKMAVAIAEKTAEIFTISHVGVLQIWK